MVSHVERKYKQDITYWAPSGGDDGYGKEILAIPVVFKGRWSDKQETFLNAHGEQVVSRATIHYPPNMTIIEGGWLARGVYRPSDGNPKDIAGAIIVRRTAEIPDLRNLSTVKMAMVA